GGCFETTRRFEETADCFEQFGVLHYCKTDISNRVARTTSMSFSNIFVPLLQTLIDFGSASNLMKHHAGFRSGIYLYQGKLVNGFVGNHFTLPANSIDLYLSAF
ncbi:MAG: alanine dehydrogenase, partial [Parabacteroides sp.]|nr:alanine dehydrogenase [Parabacteroides sp.]